MNYSKVIYEGNTLIDLTQDTITENTLLPGYTAHDASGNQITGTAKCILEGNKLIIPVGTVIDNTLYL